MASSSNSAFASASASTSTSRADGNKHYDVFINHRGPDVKKTFVSHLHRRLTEHGLRVFLDTEKLQVGSPNWCQMEDAIRAASVHIAIFSTNYALSSWCLDELVLILESMQQKKGSTIIPVFFGVKPSQLRWTEADNGLYDRTLRMLGWTRREIGVYAQSLRILEEKITFDSETGERRPRYDSDTIRKWKKALHDVAGISGFELEAYNGRDEGKLMHDVVERVLELVPKTPLNVSKHPTGLDDKVRDFETTVLVQTQQQSEEARVVGIVGLGGVGKTTLAVAFFNDQRTKYRRSCFLPDVREKYSKRCLESLQIQLIKDLTGLDLQISNTRAGMEEIRKHLASYHALIILDDVDHIDQLDALILPAKDVLGSGSLIIVTSRERGVLTSWRIGASFIYQLQGLNPQHSMELFCSHAFGQPHPVEKPQTLVDKFGDKCGGLPSSLKVIEIPKILVHKFVDKCDGLPLSLKVIGALLCGRDLKYWEEQLLNISKILPKDIRNILKISYDSLDDHEKQMFLDIACFFIGEEKDKVIRIWDASGWQGWLGLQILQNKCLVERKEYINMHDHVRDLGRHLEGKKYINMHDHIRDLGRHLAKEESPCRINGLEPSWSVTDDFHFEDLREVEIEIKRLAEGHRPVNERRLDRFLERGCTIFSVGQQVIWLVWKWSPHSSLPSSIPMENLRVLEIVHHHELETLWQKAPLELRELCISKTTKLTKIPESIGQLKHLEKIVLHGYADDLKLESLPDEFSKLQSLKHLEMKSLQYLQSLPDSFGDLANLQHINLSSCKNLKMLPDSFGNLGKLKFLSLRLCEQLTISQETLRNITTLGYLDLSFCQKIKVLPPQIPYQRSLRQMFLEQSSLEELPSDIGNLSNLKILELESTALSILPPSFGHLKSLEDLRFSRVRCFRQGISFLGIWAQLKRLSISHIYFKELAFSHIHPKQFEIEECQRRKWKRADYEPFVRILGKLEVVCPNLEYLRVSDCDVLKEVGGSLPTTLRLLMLRRCNLLTKMGDLSNLSKLHTIHIQGCGGLMELPNFERLESLQELKVRGCRHLKRIQGLAQLTKLKLLSLEECSNLEELPGVEHSKSLKKVNIFRCSHKLRLDQKLLEWLHKLRLEQKLLERLSMGQESDSFFDIIT